MLPSHVIGPLQFLVDGTVKLDLINNPEQFLAGQELFTADKLVLGMLGPFGMHGLQAYLSALFDVLIDHLPVLNIKHQLLIFQLQQIAIAAYSLVKYLRYTTPRYVWELSGNFRNFLVLFDQGKEETAFRVSTLIEYTSMMLRLNGFGITSSPRLKSIGIPACLKSHFETFSVPLSTLTSYVRMFIMRSATTTMPNS